MKKSTKKSLANEIVGVSDLVRRTPNQPPPKTQRVLLQNVSLTIGEGQRIGLTGPSGSGKSTLLRAIVMLDRCDSGEVRFSGQSVPQDAVPSFRRQVIYMPQRPAFVASTVRENLVMPFHLESSGSDFDEAQAERFIDELGRSRDLLDQPVSDLSGGEQQMIALVRALLLRPQVMLLDEPTASLDAESAHQYERLIDRWHREDDSRAFVWTSHDRNQINRMTTRRVAMRDGVLEVIAAEDL